MEKYTKEYFIKKFSKIPSRQIITGDFETDKGKCAYGHCGVREHVHMSSMPEAVAVTCVEVEPSTVIGRVCAKADCVNKKQNKAKCAKKRLMSV